MADSDCDSGKKWTNVRKKLLLTTRLRYEGDFVAKRRKRAVLWEKVLKYIKEVDSEFPFSRDDFTRKFLNYMVTYKRIKQRNNTSGEAATYWEFYDVPQETLDSSLLDILSGTGDNNDSPESDGSLRKPKSKPIRKKCDVLSFLEKEASADKEVRKELMQVEKEKLKVEKQKVEEMRSLRILLTSMANSK